MLGTSRAEEEKRSLARAREHVASRARAARDARAGGHLAKVPCTLSSKSTAVENAAGGVVWMGEAIAVSLSDGSPFVDKVSLADDGAARALLEDMAPRPEIGFLPAFQTRAMMPAAHGGKGGGGTVH